MWHLQRLLHGLGNAVAAPSRNPRMAVVVGRLLGAAFLICFGTGIYSHFLQEPLPWMVFLTRPIWLYQLSQGIHITAGILCFPLLFAKLYTVFPELFRTPLVRSFPHFLERASIALFVAASLMQIATGLLNTYQWYELFPFPFRQTHFALSFVIIGSLAIHIAVKLPAISQYWTRAGSYEADGVTLTPATSPHVSTSPVSPDRDTTGSDQPHRGLTGRVVSWIEATPQPSPKTSRRGFLTIVGIASAAVVTFTAGQSFRLFDVTNIFGPRKNDIGPNGLPINRTAEAAKVVETASADDWMLTLTNGGLSRTLSRADLLALPQHTVELPIACVEGWSQMATWTGVRLRDLADSVDAPAGASLRAISLEQKSSYAKTTVGPEYVRDELTLVALSLNGETLDLDHGYPARLIAPGRPGVMQTKWLSSLEVL